MSKYKLTNIDRLWLRGLNKKNRIAFKKKITKTNLINKMTIEDVRFILKVVENPPEPNEALKKARENYKKFKEDNK